MPNNVQCKPLAAINIMVSRQNIAHVTVGSVTTSVPCQRSPVEQVAALGIGAQDGLLALLIS